MAEGGRTGVVWGVGWGLGGAVHGQVLLHMPGGMAGASHRGILLKVRQADLPITSAWGRYWACKPCVCVHVCVCVFVRRVYESICRCLNALSSLCPRVCVCGATGIHQCMRAVTTCAGVVLAGMDHLLVCIHVWWSLYALTPTCIICVSACQAVRWTGPSGLLPPSIPPPPSRAINMPGEEGWIRQS